MVGCAEKPMAKNVVDLAGNLKVEGWQTSQNTVKPKVIIKKVVEYKTVPLKDSDHDGVPDAIDKCPNTPRGMAVDHNGCPIITTLRLNFDFNKWKVKKIYYPEIKKIAEIMKANPKLKIEIAGYTDDIGSAKYNLWLSKKRAEAVRDILVKVYKINPDRIVVKGFGEKYPLVPNTNPTNRALNRRVEIVNITNEK
jgi:OOP family OmpA-OmpF porin